ncbi:SDR family NAD(P)-dependent oxidoreductase [Pseudonocardia sp. NPDC049154]|uniref:SDR family NAD(P)-dependent oxidoreductase n=1 Tax=Pseudonocardia sp. NPDC049154 TaxID=3155501 RepID=UPI0033EDD4C2
MLAGKTILVTGAGRGLGAAYATECARQGASVVVNDLDATVAEETAAAISSAGGTAVAAQADVRRSTDVERLVERTVAEYGRIDGLVNNAGVFRMNTLLELDPEELQLLLETNVVGTFLCASAAAKRMREQGSGAIVNVTSGAHAGIPMMSGYAATKGAVASATYTWAQELAGYGVRVNAVSPQARTRMSDITAEYLTSHGHPSYPGTQPEAESNAGTVAFLLSDRAADVTGQLVRIEGTQLALMTHPCVLLPLSTRESWPAEAVADAFAEDLGKRQQPTGIRGLSHGEVGGVPSVFWSDESEES